MTSTAVMAVRSRSSLRVLRRDPNDPGENSDQPPPSKRPRLHPPPSRRRKSSPDLLDTTIESPPPSSASTKLRRPRPLFAIPSPHTTSPPSAGTPRARNLRLHHYNHAIPTSTSAALYVNGGPESPDPLDTISPAPAASLKSKSQPKLSLNANAASTPTSAAYRQRRVTQPPKSESEHPGFERSKPNTSRHLRGPAVPPAEPTPTLLSVPAGTADRAVPEKRRSLRSHDGGSRARSELAQYFPNYEELISLEPPKTELLSGSTVIKLVDDLAEIPLQSSTSSDEAPDTPFGNPLVNLYKCEVITLPDIPASDEPKHEPTLDSESGSKNENENEKKEQDEDPLNTDHYFKPHRRHERQEKQLRNIERDRAQHEKQQLDRLLEELKSHDWLRIMGITGRSLSEQDKKRYEPKRDYFIKEISALLQKFKIWKEEEKRKKLNKTSSFHSDPADSQHAHANAKDKDTEREDEYHNLDLDLDTTSPSLSPHSIPNTDPEDTDIDIDTLASRQLLQEAHSATKHKNPKSKHDLLPIPPPPPPGPEKPFTSFYAKPHLREQAMSGNRKGRTRLAFGHPIPELTEREFVLPGDILTEEAIRKGGRRRRRLKRGSLSEL
ncbi:something about silencing, SAS, complex subunit 4-domain-containing protein [Aspergillus karnatakaensis]|uniref:acetyltransferase SAS4-like domain-containing protein n=1 Tax=Aspergillus karnatakaensis TaxID=1810916 RepID=UPI003CCD237B